MVTTVVATIPALDVDQRSAKNAGTETDNPYSQPTEVAYDSKLTRWDDIATVRRRPRRIIMKEEDESGLTYFPAELVPAYSHPSIVRLGPSAQRELLVQRLHLYLRFTEQLEHKVVNKVAEEIAHREIDFGLPAEMRLDAYKLYVDEAYHAYFSAELEQQIEIATGITPIPVITPQFLQGLRQMQESLTPEMRHLAEVFFTIVSETLISATLSKIPRDKHVITAVRELVADHAEDEGRHHAYFSSLLEILWPRLSREQKATVGPLLPHFILGFLAPDFPATKQVLERLGLSERAAEEVIQDCYPQELVLSDTREAAKASIRLFKRSGVLEEPGTMEAFVRTGLLSGSDA